MDEAFLLAAKKRIITSIEICDDRASKTRKQWLQKLRLPIRPQSKDHSNTVSKDPHILILPRDVHLCFVEMHDGTCHESAQEQIFGSSMVFSELLNEAHRRLERELF